MIRADRFQVTAHRGASATHPENTLAAFAEASRLGVDRMEFDVRRTLDGGLFILHDPTIDRTTDGSGPILELTTCLVAGLDAGGWFAPRFRGQRVPTFTEALAACPMVCNVNLYPGPDDLEAIVDEVVAALADAGRLADSYIAASAAVVDRVARVEPRLERCLLEWAGEHDYPERSADRGCRILQPSNRVVTPEFIARAHALGQEVHPFFADDEGEMRRLIDCGVDGILTNQPARLLALIGRATTAA